MLEQLNWADYAILGAIILSTALGLRRGFMREVLSLAAWVVALIVALVFLDKATAALVPVLDVPSVRLVLAFGALFLATLFLGGLVNLMVARMIQGTGLRSTDHSLGAVFGALRGVAVVAAVVLLAGFTPLPQDPWWHQSQLLAYFEDLALWLQDFLPGDLTDTLYLS